MLRSHSSIKGKGPIMPVLCVICNKQKSMKHDGKRKLEPLSKAETLTAGMLMCTNNV